MQYASVRLNLEDATILPKELVLLQLVFLGYVWRQPYNVNQIALNNPQICKVASRIRHIWFGNPFAPTGASVFLLLLLTLFTLSFDLGQIEVGQCDSNLGMTVDNLNLANSNILQHTSFGSGGVNVSLFGSYTARQLGHCAVSKSDCSI